MLFRSRRCAIRLRDAADQPVLGTLIGAMESSVVQTLLTGDKDLLALHRCASWCSTAGPGPATGGGDLLAPAPGPVPPAGGAAAPAVCAGAAGASAALAGPHPCRPCPVGLARTGGALDPVAPHPAELSDGGPLPEPFLLLRIALAQGELLELASRRWRREADWQEEPLNR